MQTSDIIEGQMNTAERTLLTEAVREADPAPQIAVEVGTWLGGGSTLHILRALEARGCGHLFGIEADRSIYDRMIASIERAAPECRHRFTPLFGFSDEVIPRWLRELQPEQSIDFAFLDGGNNPMEQILEFRLLDPRIPVGGQLMSHDAKLRKGKWLVPYLSKLDHWEVAMHDGSEVGLLHARKVRMHPSPASRSTAERLLLKMRSHPVELAAQLLPPWANKAILHLLPQRLMRKLAEGR